MAEKLPTAPPRGMRDFLPSEKTRRERVLGVIREHYRAHGFDEIVTRKILRDNAEFLNTPRPA